MKLLSLILLPLPPLAILFLLLWHVLWAVCNFHGRLGQGKQRKSKLQNLRHLNSNQITNKAKFVSFTTEFQILSKKPKYQFKNMKRVKTIEILKNIYYNILYNYSLDNFLRSS